MHRQQQTTKSRHQATAQVSFYDGGSHESSASTIRTEVRSPAGGGRLLSGTFFCRWHRPHAAHRTSGRGCVLACHGFPVCVSVAVSGAILARAARFLLHGRTGGERAVRAADSLLRRRPVVLREVRGG